MEIGAATVYRHGNRYELTVTVLVGILIISENSASALESDWTWQNPLPQGNLLCDLWGTGPSNIYTIGEYGKILRYDGSSWSSIPTQTKTTFWKMWGSDQSNIFVVGENGTILRFNVSGWSTMTSGTTDNLCGVWGADASNVFTVGYNGTILHYDGSAWSAMVSGTVETLLAVWGTGDSNIFAVGYNGTILHYNGSAWSTMTSGTSETLFDLWGTDASNVFAVGGSGSVLHYNGSTWSVVAGGLAMGLWDIWGSDASNIFAVGMQGAILHYNGSDWSTMVSGTTDMLVSVWGSGPTDVYAVGFFGTMLHYDGSAWTVLSSGPSTYFYGTWGTSRSDRFVVGASGAILHYDGSTWSPMVSGTTEGLEAVWGTSSTSVYTVGAAGTIRRYNGSTWSAMTSGTTRKLYGIWGTGDSNIYVVGVLGTIRHYNGSAWSGMTSPTTRLLYDIWGSDNTDIFAVGDYGTIIHYNGSAWSAMTSGTTTSLYDIWGSSGSDVFAVGKTGAILHYDGSTWSPMVSGTNSWIYCIWGPDGSDVTMVGLYGVIMHYNGEGTLSVDSTPVKGEIFVDGISWGIAPQSRSVVAGPHNVTFDAIADYNIPTSRNITVTCNDTAIVTGTYVHHEGILSIDSAPVKGEVFVDGQSWGTAPQTRQIPVGSHTISFGTVTDYDTPANQTVTITRENTSSITGTYTLQTGTLSVNTTPVRGEIFIDGRSISTGPQTGIFPVGSHTISFGPVGGYISPVDQVVTMAKGQPVNITGTYIPVPPKTGVLSIETVPVKGEISVDGQSWGTVPQSKALTVGTHTVRFGPMPGYTPPADQTVTVTENNTTAITGTYVLHTGTLSIDTTPVAAEVFVDGQSWGIAPQSKTVPLGTYTVGFGPVGGYISPVDQTVTMTKDRTSSVTGAYTAILVVETGTLTVDTEIVKGEILVDGISWGIAPQSRELPTGPHTVTFGTITGYTSPMSPTVTVEKNQTLSVKGTYIHAGISSNNTPSAKKDLQEKIQDCDLYGLILGLMIAFAGLWLTEFKPEN